MTAAAVSAARLARAARAQTGLPEGRVGDPRPAWEGRLRDVYGVTVEGRARNANAFFHVTGDRVSVPAGPEQAARVLAELGALDGGPWDGGLIYVVVAAGGAMPGFPDVWRTDETPLEGGGVRIVVRASERWIAYAAAGGAGPPPLERGDGGLGAPARMTSATLDVDASYGLRWSYRVGGRELDGPAAAAPASAPPLLSDEQLAEALDGARTRAAAPRAMPAREPRPLEGYGDEVVVVDLWALGAVPVLLGGDDGPVADRLEALGVDWDAPPAVLVALLCAAGALPPGLLPADLLASTRASDNGELVADVPAPLVEWAAGGARQLSPRVAGVRTPEEMARPGRVRLALDGSARWTLEVGDEAGAWHPASAGGP